MYSDGGDVLTDNMYSDGIHTMIIFFSVIVVKKENSHGRKQTLHRKHLLPIRSINEEFDEDRITQQNPVPLPRRSKRKPASLRKKPAPVKVSTDSNTESEDESMVYVLVAKPHQDIQQEIQPDDVIQVDDDTASVEDTIPSNADDDQDRTEEQSELEEDASLPEESGGSEHETSLHDQIHDLAANASPDIRTDDDSTKDDNIDDYEEKDQSHNQDDLPELRHQQLQPSTRILLYRQSPRVHNRNGWFVLTTLGLQHPLECLST
ncbi:unnamed protein product [Mytilus coruscus]|uniref:Uncharacterized protein n=1 Tax=Mytilus coruscus TaxID=42192 RepID=A0A6J8EDL5_MYTCO|nr:unnamed protein product [Mytilus coruscus]